MKKPRRGERPGLVVGAGGRGDTVATDDGGREGVRA